MKTIVQVLQTGTGVPVRGARVQAKRTTAAGITINSITDDEGFAWITWPGTPGPIIIHANRQGASYDIYNDIFQDSGPYDWYTHRQRIKTLLGNGVHFYYGTVFSIIDITQARIQVGPGAVVLDGILATWVSPTSRKVVSGLRALVAQLDTTLDAISLEDIAQSAIDLDIHVPLYTYEVGGGNEIIASTLEWVGKYVGPASGRATKMSAVRQAGGSTNDTVGTASALTTSLTLENGVTYDVMAEVCFVTRGTDGALALDINGDVSPYQGGSGDITQLVSNAHQKAIVGTGAAIPITMKHRSDTLLTNWANVNTYASYGTGNGQLALPEQIAVDASNNIYVANYANNRLEKLNSVGAYLAKVTGMTYCSCVCVSGSYVFITRSSAGSYRVDKRLTSDLSLVSFWVTGTNPPNAITTDGSYVYVTFQGDYVEKRRFSDMSLVSTWGSTGTGNGQFKLPFGISVYGGEVYVADRNNSRVQVFSPTGTYKRQFPVRPFPNHLTVNALGVWVASNYDSTVTLYSTTGTPLTTITQPGARGVTMQTGDVVLISNRDSGVINVWDQVPAAFTWNAGVLTARAIPRG